MRNDANAATGLASGDSAVPLHLPDWPAEAIELVGWLAANSSGYADRRAVPRRPYHVLGDFRTFSADARGEPAFRLYTRDVSIRALGFLSPRHLQPGMGGELSLPLPSGNQAEVRCIILRCRQLAASWYEGALSFVREQMEFMDASQPHAFDNHDAPDELFQRSRA